MAKRRIKFKLFKLTNLITDINKNKTHLNYYNHRITDFILLNLLSYEKKLRKKTYNYQTETIYLSKYNPYYSEDYSCGQIITIKHGKEQRNVNVDDLSLVGLIQTNEGLEYTIDFFIHKKTGFIFVEQDGNHVLNISRLRSLLKMYTKETKQLILYLNTLETDYILEYKPVINIEIIKPLDVKKQIKNLATVKSVSIFEKNGVQDKDIEDIHFDDTEDNENFFKLVSDGINSSNISEYDTILKLTKFSNNKFSGSLEKFIEYVIDSDKFGGYSIEGKDSYGVNRIFTPDTLTRDIQFETEADKHGHIEDKVKLEFIIKYLKENIINMPTTFSKNEPTLNNHSEFLKKFTEYKGDFNDYEDKDEEK
ncbi:MULTISPECIES: hypothetical protein [Mammaliicoccus]|uniref:hypothetical protein n=1 Tax=Mammaliicoccus TaxID=2803850 RepID=UPI001EFAA0BB|nr:MULTISPECIES: hypothetical protein [Mammaliicoccus]MEB7067100.1 hypothetical protein [Mammaliicoccus sciuri]